MLGDRGQLVLLRASVSPLCCGESERGWVSLLLVSTPTFGRLSLAGLPGGLTSDLLLAYDRCFFPWASFPNPYSLSGSGRWHNSPSETRDVSQGKLRHKEEAGQPPSLELQTIYKWEN